MNSLKTSELNTKKILLTFILAMFVSDFIMKLYKIEAIPVYYRISGLVKIIFEVFLLIKAVQNGMKKEFWIIILVLIVSFFIGQYTLQDNNFFTTKLLSELTIGDTYHLNKYIFIVLFVGVVQKMKNKLALSSKAVDMLVILLTINAVLIVLGTVFDINLFKSFPNSSRFGYSGLFTKSGESVLLYCIVAVHYYLKFLKNKRIAPVIFFIGIALLSGKKIAILLPIALYVLHFCMYSKHRVVYRGVGASIIAVALFFAENITRFTVRFFPFWEQILLENSLITVLTSTRNLALIKAKTYVVEKWRFLNYIFGGVDYNNYKIEVDPFDLFVFFGLFGGGVYLWFIVKNYVMPYTKMVKYSIVSLFVLGMIYGAFLFNILLMLCLFLFSIAFKNEPQEVAESKFYKK